MTNKSANFLSQPANGVPEWGIGPFVRVDTANPVLSPSQSLFDCPMRGKQVAWEGAYVFNPAAVVREGLVNLIYRAEDGRGDGPSRHTSCLGHAVSRDGLSFERSNTPVLYPDGGEFKQFEWPGGCEDPRIVEREEGGFVMLYSAWDRKTVRLSAATSNDLTHWTKRGPIFARSLGGKFRDTWSKSGAVVTRLSKDRLVAARIDGKYWMYWGEGAIYGATSNDLIDWSPVVDSDLNLKVLIATRKGRFDSSLCEPGPPALINDHGILLLYNGRNDESHGDAGLALGSYSAGQAMFDLTDPTHLIGRTDVPFFSPSNDYERTGQYADGTVFIEGLVYLQSKWILYYGTADSHVGAAIWEPG